MFGIKKKNRADGNWSYLSPESVVKGQLCFRETTAYFDGKINGDIISIGTLSARESAVIKGNIFVESLVLSGTVYGDIKASKTIYLTPGAKVFGDLYYGELTIEGATHEGTSHKLTEEENNQLREFCEQQISAFDDPGLKDGSVQNRENSKNNKKKKADSENYADNGKADMAMV